jgi:hypothetical protein
MTKRGPHRHKSSYSGGSGSCVEVAEGRAVLVRDTQNRELGHIDYTPEAWAAFLRYTTLTNP